jgi:hypothetical protein
MVYFSFLFFPIITGLYISTFPSFETHRQICCFGGKISLPKSTKLSDYICNLLTEKDNEFRNNIRAYNSALSFTSIGYNEDLRLNNNKSMF